MHSKKTYLAVAGLMMLLAALWAGLPVYAAEDNTPADSTVTAAPASQPPVGVQPAEEEQTSETSKKRLVLLPAYNIYFPSGSKAQERFGDSWPAWGISLAWRDKNTDPKRIELRLDGIGAVTNRAKVRIFPIGIGISQRIFTTKKMVSYVGVSGNLYIGKVRSSLDHVDTGYKLTGGPGAFLGLNVGSRFNVQASYYAVPKIGGFGLSGFNVSAHYMLF